MIGNPPYVQIENIPPVDREYFISAFGENGTLGKRYDLYQVFLMQAMKCLRTGGATGLILPNTFLMGHSFELLRKRLFEQMALIQIVDLPQGVFKGVTVDNVLLFARREPDPTERSSNLIHVLRLFAKSEKSRVASMDWDERFDMPQARIAEGEAQAINISARPEIQATLAKMVSHSVKLGEIAEASQGIILYETAAAAEKCEHTGTTARTGWKRLLRGKNIGRYTTRWDGEYVNYGRWLWRAREQRFFEEPKILLHAMRNKSLARRLVGTYDSGRYYNAHNLANIILRAEAKVDLRFILGVFNSCAANFWYRSHFQNVNINPADLVQLPVPRVDLQLPRRKQHDHIVELVSRMLDLHAQISAAKHPHAVEQLRRQIEATDRQIDQLVYQLYGLTDAEIRIVEEAMA